MKRAPRTSVRVLAQAQPGQEHRQRQFDLCYLNAARNGSLISAASMRNSAHLGFKKRRSLGNAAGVFFRNVKICRAPRAKIGDGADSYLAEASRARLIGGR